MIGSGTALLASLLAGDENFGKVLGNYAGKQSRKRIEDSFSEFFHFFVSKTGLAIDGFSGGGGAVNDLDILLEN